MGARELASWRENKKTIVNSLKTLSSQIYSATARIVFELIQNADDCTFADDGRLRELHLECDEDALVAFHNEKGFQPKDLYAMCQVGESSKQAGSGKIGRKGIGFKSTFQITDCPLIVSPPSAFASTRRRAASLATSCRRGSSSRSSTCRRATTRYSAELARRRRRRHAARVPVCVACTRHRSAARL